MITFILLLYVLAANGFVIPEAIWTISWVLFATTSFAQILKTVVECNKTN